MISIVIGTNRNNAVSGKIAQQYHELFASKEIPSQIIDLSKLPADFTSSALYENAGKNAAFNVFREQMLNSPKFLFVVPEYNGSMPGVLKAFIDGLAFPTTFKGKKAGIVGVSSGLQGAILAMSHLTDAFNYLQMDVMHLKPKLFSIEKKMDGDKVSDPLYLELMEKQVTLLNAF